METRRRCDCLSGPCCQAVSTASPGRASVAPASDAPKMEERMEVFVSGIRPSLGECSELLSPKRTPRLGDGSRRHLTSFQIMPAVSRTPQGASQHRLLCTV